MPTWQWILIAAAIIVVIALVVLAVRSGGGRKRSEELKQHFGPEYDRTVERTGDPKAAEKELAARARKRDKLDIVALSPVARNDFEMRWTQVQTEFVDDPTRAVGTADLLVTEVMRQRGYPVDDFERRAADISVDHPHIVENYRAAHSVHTAQERGEVDTERQREAFVHYRALFERLLDTTDSGSSNDTSKEARA
ncbi:hypothetical protein FK535_07215 [Mycolicibacterium sp. 018/SC-01/001]|uniref:hypothetical protein n=1 Tax=Mycolicibacterium sp. 018/SC-01/001 TaxID=2592069 RepID=UPI001180177A|nr:hypothetical protein [Mycolicibacterium sp. 018/SC-01/001]TRW86246.1 hypothetical protein FK535_07215 [Mycolicibacterium sp. 018/SC-01/001]